MVQVKEHDKEFEKCHMEVLNSFHRRRISSWFGLRRKVFD